MTNRIYNSWRWKRVAPSTDPVYRENYFPTPSNYFGVFRDNNNLNDFHSYFTGSFESYWYWGGKAFNATCEDDIGEDLPIFAGHSYNGTAGGFGPYSGYPFWISVVSNNYTAYFYDLTGTLRKKAIMNNADSAYAEDYIVEISHEYAILVWSPTLTDTYYISIPIIDSSAFSPAINVTSVTKFKAPDGGYPRSFPQYHEKQYGSNVFSDGINLYHVDGYSVTGNSHISVIGTDPYVATNGLIRNEIMRYSTSTIFPESWYDRYDNTAGEDNGHGGLSYNVTITNYDQTIELPGITRVSKWEWFGPYVDDETPYFYINDTALSFSRYDGNNNPVLWDTAGCVWKMIDNTYVCLNPISGYRPRNCEYYKEFTEHRGIYGSPVIKHVWYIDDSPPNEQMSIYMVAAMNYSYEGKPVFFKYKLIPCGVTELGPQTNSGNKLKGKFAG